MDQEGFGKWVIDGREEIPGEIRFDESNGEITLHCIEHLDLTIGKVIPRISGKAIVNGHLRYITLFHCFVQTSGFLSTADNESKQDQLPYISISPEITIIGGYLSDIDSTCVDSMSIYSDVLDIWCNYLQRECITQKSTEKIFTISEKSKYVKADMKEEIVTLFSTMTNVKFPKEHMSSISVTPVSKLKIDFHKPVNIVSLIDKLFKYKKLFEVLLLHPFSFRKIRFHHKDCGDCELLYSPFGLYKKINHSIITPINYAWIQDSMTTIFEKWDDVYTSNYYGIISIFLGGVLNKNQLPENVFLDQIKAVVRIYSLKGLNKPVKEGVLKKIRKIIKNALRDPQFSGYRDRICGLLNLLRNEPPIKCLTEIFNASHVKDVFGEEDVGRKKYADKLISVRNALVHPEEKTEQNKLDNQQYTVIVKRLFCLVYSVLLKEIGVDEETIEEALIRKFSIRLLIENPPMKYEFKEKTKNDHTHTNDNNRKD